VLNRALKTALDDPLLWYQLGITKQDDPAPFEKAVALDGEFAEARNLLGAAAGDLDRAGRQFVRALEINPDLAEALGNYGHLLAARGDYTEAAFYLARSIKLKPGDGEVRTNYAVALAGLGRFDEAEEQTDAALKADPKSAEAHNFHGTLLERRGQTAAALREYQEAMRLQPDFEAARRNAARLAR